MLCYVIPTQLFILVPIVPLILLGLLLMAIATLKACIFHKGPAILTLLVLICLILGMFIPIRFFELSFSYLYLIFVWFGSLLAFDKIDIQEDSENSTAA